MSGEIIKEFLVGLGFDVDDASLKKFNKSIADAALKVTALYGSIQLTAAAIGAGIASVAEDFEKLGYEYRIIAPAINKALLLRRELLKAYSAAGINITKVVQESVKFNFALAKTKFALQAIYQSVAARFFPLLTKQLDILRGKLYANLPKIQNGLEKFIKLVFKAFEATVILGERLWSILGRVYDFFVALDKATDGWSTVILAVVAAWRLLNLSFLATPLGMIIAGLAAILALYDDFKTWEEGGKSLFNWSTFVPVINAVKVAVTAVHDALAAMFDTLFPLIASFGDLFHLDFTSWANHMSEAIESVFPLLSKLGAGLSAVYGIFDKAGWWLNGTIGAAGGYGPNAAPLGSQGAAGGNTNQNVHQQTNITVQGSPNAAAVGGAVASQQTDVNADLVRNLMGATR